MHEKSKRTNIIIFWWSALGDSIVITPFLKNLKLNIENVQITYVTWNLIWLHQINNVPYIDKIIKIKISDIKSLINMFKILLFGKTDFIVFDHSFYSFPILKKYILSKLCIRAKSIIFDDIKYSKYFSKVFQWSTENVVTQYKVIVEYIVWKEINFDDKLELFIDMESEKWYINHLINTYCNFWDRKYIVHLWWENKRKVPWWTISRCWETSKWISLFKKILTASNNSKIFIIWWKEDFQEIELHKKSFKWNQIINMAWKLTIEQSAELINQWDIFISTDSWPMHIACALKKEQIALLSRWSHKIDPYIKHPIRRKETNLIQVEDVIEIIKSINIITKNKFLNI